MGRGGGQRRKARQSEVDSVKVISLEFNLSIGKV
jgi:hypothetical protein